MGGFETRDPEILWVPGSHSLDTSGLWISSPQGSGCLVPRVWMSGPRGLDVWTQGSGCLDPGGLDVWTLGGLDVWTRGSGCLDPGYLLPRGHIYRPFLGGFCHPTCPKQCDLQMIWGQDLPKSGPKRSLFTSRMVQNGRFPTTSSDPFIAF